MPTKLANVSSAGKDAAFVYMLRRNGQEEGASTHGREARAGDSTAWRHKWRPPRLNCTVELSS